MAWDVIFRTGTDLLYKQAINAPQGVNWRGRKAAQVHAAPRTMLSFILLFVACFTFLGATGRPASAETRTLKIHFVHTGEKAAITFKRNGRYDPKGLKALSNIVRDWRRNEPTKMDPRLFDLVWEVYRRSGASGYINVVSGYRSPATNTMLRSRSKGVAKESQHMQGTAMDFYIPGVPLKTLREVGMKLQAGGVGYYPNSGSPFVHMDVAGVRSWPRMSRGELARLFPDGKTVHLPSDGKPMPGYQQALADYKKRVSSSQIVMASEGGNSSGRRKNLFAMLFGGGDEDEAEDVVTPAERPTLVASSSRRQEQLQAAPTPTAVPAPAVAPEPPVLATPEPAPETAIAALTAPVPLSRPSLREEPADNSLAVALYSPNRSAAEAAISQVSAAQPDPAAAAAAQNGEFADLQAYKIPVPTLLGPRGMNGDAQAGIMTASVDPNMAVALDDGTHVPVPVGRPSVAEALLADADVAAEAEIDAVEQAILSPEAAQAIEQAEARAAQPSSVPVPSRAPLAVAASQPSGQVPLASGAKPTVRPAHKVEVASLAPARQDKQAFGDAFDPPKPHADGVTAGMPAKGGRPTQAEAQAAHRAMEGGAGLTKDSISNWALGQKGFGDAGKVVKAPRVVSRTLSSETGGNYAVGFSASNAPVDPARFGASQ